MIRKPLLFVLLGALLLPGCQPEQAWNRANASRLDSDIRELLSQYGCKAEPQKCRMVGTTRTGRCSFAVNAHEIERIVKNLGFVKINRGEEYRACSRSFDSLQDACTMSGGTSPAAYALCGRPPQLRLESGSAFQYLILLYDAESHYACMEVEYAYG